MSIKQFAILASVSLSLMTAAIPSSRAATSTAAVAVSATVAADCRIGPATDRAGQPHSLAVMCDMSVPYTVTVEGSTAAQTPSFRQSSDDTTGRVAATITY